jgi:hypothetical protein
MSSSGDVEALSHLNSFPYTCTPEVPKWYPHIKLGGEGTCPQCHPNWCSRDYLGYCGMHIVVLVEKHIGL